MKITHLKKKKRNLKAIKKLPDFTQTAFIVQLIKFLFYIQLFLFFSFLQLLNMAYEVPVEEKE